MVEFNPNAVTGVQTSCLNADHIRYEGIRVEDVSEDVMANGRVLIKDGKHTGISITWRFHRRSSQ